MLKLVENAMREETGGQESRKMKESGLHRDLGLGSAIIIVIANMIGTGIFTTSGLIMDILPSPQAMLLCWALGGVLALSGSLCFGELGAMFPTAGGEYVFLRESLGKSVGFLSGWIALIVGFSAPIAAASIAFASYLFSGITGGYADKIFFSFNGFITVSPVTITAVIVISIFSLVHWYSLYFGSRVQNFFTISKVIIIALFILGGFLLGKGSWSHFGTPLSSGLVFSGEFATSLILVSFAYSGWNASTYLGGEIKNPSRNIPLSLFWGTLAVMILYLLLNMVFVYALPPEEMRGVIEVGAKSAASLFGARTGAVFSMAVSICLMSIISAMIMAGPRVYFAMSRDGLFPRWFGKINFKHYTPGGSIFLQASIAILMVVTFSFDRLLIYIGFTLSVFSLLTVAGMMLLRFKLPHVERPYKTFGYPFTPLIFILSNLWIIVYSIKDNPVVCIYGAITILAGILMFVFFKRS